VPLPIPAMSTPVARGSRVPPWPILTCTFLLLRRRFWRWLWFSRSRAAVSASIQGAKRAEGLKCVCRSRRTWAEESPVGLWMAGWVGCVSYID
jgi:hypothetical protein